MQGPIRRVLSKSASIQSSVKQAGASPDAGVVGKLLYRPADFSVAAARTGLERSLRRLGVDRIDDFMIHEPALAVGTVGDDVLAFLESARAAGTIARWGVAGDLAPIADEVTTMRPAPGVLQMPYDLAAGCSGRPTEAPAASSSASCRPRSSGAPRPSAGTTSCACRQTSWPAAISRSAVSSPPC